MLNGLEQCPFSAGASSGEGARIGRIEAFLERPTRIVQHDTASHDRRGSVLPAAARAGRHRARARERQRRRRLWEKLARQAAMALLTSITGKPTGEVRSEPRFRANVAEACGVAAGGRRSNAVAEQWEIIESLPPVLITSTARDVAAGRPSELDAIAGGAVRAGRRLGCPRRRSRRCRPHAQRDRLSSARARVRSGSRTRTSVRSRVTRCSPTRSRPRCSPACSTASSAPPTPRRSPTSPAGTAPRSRSCGPPSLQPRPRPTSSGSRSRSRAARAVRPLRDRPRDESISRPGRRAARPRQLLATPEADSIRAVEP